MVTNLTASKKDNETTASGGPDHFWGRFVVLTGGRALGALAAFFSSVVIANYWGGDTLGTLAVYFSALSVLSVLASGGFPSVGYLLAPEYNANGQYELLKSFTLSARKHILAGSAFCAIAVFSYLLFGLALDLSTSISLTLIFAAAIFSTATLNLHGALFTGLERQFAGLLPEALLKPMLFLLIVVIAATTNQNLHAETLFFVFLAGVVLASFVSYFMIERAVHMKGSASPQNQLGRWRASALPWLLTTLATDLFIEFHILLTGYLATASEVAVLHVAFRFRVLAAFGMRSIYVLFLPRIISENASGNPAGVRTNLVRMNTLAMGYALGIFALFLVAGSFMMGLFGQTFEDGWPLLIVVSLSIVARALLGPAPAILAMHGHHKSTAITTLVMLCMSLLGATFLYPQFGTLGVAISYSASSFVTGLFLWQVAKKQTQLDCSIFAAIGQTRTHQT